MHRNQSPLPWAIIILKSGPSTQYGQRTFFGLRSLDHSIMDPPRFPGAESLRRRTEPLTPVKVSTSIGRITASLRKSYSRRGWAASAKMRHPSP